MKIKLFDISAKQIGSLTLPAAVFGAKISPQLMAQSIRVYLSNQRKAHAKTKNRSEVRGTTKKMWAQKGTGRARHGSAKAPIFVGGGVAHGPSGNQNYRLKLNKKMKKQALNSILSRFAKEKRIIAVEKFSSLPPKTSQAAKFISKLKKDNPVLNKSKKVAIITANPVGNVKRAFSNLPYVNLMNLNSLSVYQLAKQKYLVFSSLAIKNLSSK